MSYYNQQPPVGVPPPQGYPPEGFTKGTYVPPGYPPQGYPPQSYPPPGYPPQGYPPPYAQAPPPPPQKQSSGPSFVEGWSRPWIGFVSAAARPLVHDSGSPVIVRRWTVRPVEVVSAWLLFAAAAFWKLASERGFEKFGQYGLI
ncbi:unnamed protein product [Musa banksii]